MKRDYQTNKEQGFRSSHVRHWCSEPVFGTNASKSLFYQKFSQKGRNDSLNLKETQNMKGKDQNIFHKSK